MQMSEAEFFDQPLIFWRDRLDGFSELHGGGTKSGDDALSREDLARLMDEHPD